MSANEWIAIAAIAIPVVGAILGGLIHAVWLSASLHTEVRALRNELAEFKAEMRQEVRGKQ